METHKILAQKVSTTCMYHLEDFRSMSSQIAYEYSFFEFIYI